MAQDALTVTPPNPSPPTNVSSTGSAVPNPATYDPTVYGTDVHFPDPDLAPFYDDGIEQADDDTSVNNSALAGTAFAAKHAALAVGGTTYDPEGLGTEEVVTADVDNPSPHGQLVTVSAGPDIDNGTITIGSPINVNASHPSYLTGSAVPTTSATSAGGVSGAGSTLLTVTGTNFNRSSVVYVDGVKQTTNYVSATSLTVTNAPKKSTAGNRAVTVVNGNGAPSNATNWVFT